MCSLDLVAHRFLLGWSTMSCVGRKATCNFSLEYFLIYHISRLKMFPMSFPICDCRFVFFSYKLRENSKRGGKISLSYLFPSPLFYLVCMRIRVNLTYANSIIITYNKWTTLYTTRENSQTCNHTFAICFQKTPWSKN